MRRDVVYEDEIVDIAGAVDGLALRGMLEGGVGEDRRRAVLVRCPNVQQEKRKQYPFSMKPM